MERGHTGSPVSPIWQLKTIRKHVNWAGNCLDLDTGCWPVAGVVVWMGIFPFRMFGLSFKGKIGGVL